MTEGTADVSRRAFMRTAAGATAAAGASGVAAGQDNESDGGDGGGGGTPDFGGFLDDVDNFDDNVEDATGSDSATVEVGVEANGGAYGFGPAAIHVDNGATVQWEWTGEGGGHNVVSDGDGPLSSDTYQEAGVHYEHTFEEDGVFPYVCEPHEGMGMKGAVVVGTDYPTADSGGGGGGGGSSAGGPAMPDSVKSMGVATSFVMLATLGMGYVFIKYGGDYDQPE